MEDLFYVGIVTLVLKEKITVKQCQSPIGLWVTVMCEFNNSYFKTVEENGIISCHPDLEISTARINMKEEARKKEADL